MNVKELIEKLQQFDPEVGVMVGAFSLDEVVLETRLFWDLYKQAAAPMTVLRLDSADYS